MSLLEDTYLRFIQKYQSLSTTQAGGASRNESVSVGATSVSVAQATPRQAFVITNTGATVITVVLGNQAAVAGAGIVLQANGQITDSDSFPYECWQGAINAVGNAGGGTVGIFER